MPTASARLSLVSVAVAAWALAAAPRPVAAQPRKAEARELYQRGMRHYELGEFDAAITEFKASYEISAAPGLLFNLGQVYRVKGDYPQALRFYRTFLRLSPNTPNRADVEGLIAELQADVDRANRPPPPPSPSEPKPALTPPPPVAAMPAPAPLPGTTPAPAPAPTPAAPPRRNWRLELWTGGALAVAGLAALGAGIGLGVVAQHDSDQLTRASDQGNQPWDGGRQSLWRDGHNDAIAATALYVTGGVLTAAGAAVLALGLHDRHRERALAWTPVPAGGGLAWRY